MRLSRPCYDKMHRCPGWAGGGMRSARRDRCQNGRLRRDGDVDSIYDGRLWRWRFNRCDSCDVLVLPSVIRWLDPRWLVFWGGQVIDDALEARDERRRRRAEERDTS